MTPKRPPMAKEGRQKLAEVKRQRGACATCGKIRGALLKAARLVMPGR